MYRKPIHSIKRKLADNIVIASAPCAIPVFGRLNVGARMSIFEYDNQIIVWSAFPFCEDVQECLDMLKGEVTHLIIPNIHHNIGVKSFKEKFPNLTIVGGEFNIEGITIDQSIPKSYGNKILKEADLKEIGLSDVIAKNFEIVSMISHKNKDLVLYDKNSKILFTADITIDMSPRKDLEQFKEEVEKDGFDPHWGYWGNSFLSRFLQPDYNFFKNRVNLLNGANKPEGQEALKLIYGMDINKIVPCHGNVVDNKDTLKKFYSFL